MGLPQGLQLGFTQLQAGEFGALGLAGRRLDACFQGHRVGRTVGRGCPGGQAAVQRPLGQLAPEQGGANALGGQAAFPVPHSGGLALGVEPESALALQRSTAQLGRETGYGPLVTPLRHLGLQRPHWQSFLIGRADQRIVELQGRPPGLPVGPGLEPTRQVGGGRIGPQRGQVEGLGAGLGGNQGLGGPGLHAGLEIQLAGLGPRRLRPALGLGGDVERGVGPAEGADGLSPGREVNLGAVGDFGGDIAPQVEVHRHGRLAVQIQLACVETVGQSQAIQPELVAGRHRAGRLGRRPGDLVGYTSVAVVSPDVGQFQVGVAAERQRSQLKSQTHRDREGERFHGLGGRGRPLVPDLECAHPKRRQVHAAPLQGVQPESIVPVELYLGGAHIQLALAPVQRGDGAAAAQAALHVLGLQTADAVTFRATLQPALGPAQRLGQRPLCAGPQPEGHGTGQHQGQEGARHPHRHPCGALEQRTQAAASFGWDRFGWGGACVGGCAHQKLKPTLRWIRNRLASSP